MSVAVRVEGLGKRYRVGRARQHETLGGLLLDVATAPVRNVRRHAKDEMEKLVEGGSGRSSG